MGPPYLSSAWSSRPFRFHRPGVSSAADRRGAATHTIARSRLHRGAGLEVGDRLDRRGKAGLYRTNCGLPLEVPRTRRRSPTARATAVVPVDILKTAKPSSLNESSNRLRAQAACGRSSIRNQVLHAGRDVHLRRDAVIDPRQGPSPVRRNSSGTWWYNRCTSVITGLTWNP